MEGSGGYSAVMERESHMRVVGVTTEGGDMAKIMPAEHNGLRVVITDRATHLDDLVREVTRPRGIETKQQQEGGWRFEPPVPAEMPPLQSPATETPAPLFADMDAAEKKLGLLPEQHVPLENLTQTERDALERRLAMTKKLQEGRGFLQKKLPKLLAIGATAFALHQSATSPEAHLQPLPQPEPVTQSFSQPEPLTQTLNARPSERKEEQVATMTAEKPALPAVREQEQPALFEKYTLKKGEFPWMVIDRLVQQRFNDGTMDPAALDKLTNALTSLEMGADNLNPGPAYKLQPGQEISIPTMDLMHQVQDALGKMKGEQSLVNIASILSRPDLSPTGPGKVKETAKTWVDGKLARGF
jgi:hypothetical protein